MLHIFAFSLIMTAVLWLLAVVAAKWMHLSEGSKRALTLTLVFSNANNYGLPVLLLAFGQSGFHLAPFMSSVRLFSSMFLVATLHPVPK
ncbi:hypothetical protein NBRC111894_805 [Sporolactobacillus inulinus]|uniref:Transporter n=1 Tax=Sporolactobacillus inulinus TaxID=2078 RepID=A0A4Y1Z8N6_9BACL|nr:hypothetical protein NBRC111894_805 [Sporolactobacillus inulinus]